MEQYNRTIKRNFLLAILALTALIIVGVKTGYIVKGEPSKAKPCEHYGRYDYSVPKYKRGIVCKP